MSINSLIVETVCSIAVLEIVHFITERLLLHLPSSSIRYPYVLPAAIIKMLNRANFVHLILELIRVLDRWNLLF